MARYQELKVWQLAHQLAREVRAIVRRFPAEERFELASQLRRAVLSVPTNIVEGSGLRGPRGFLRHIRIAIGSLREVTYLLLYAKDDGYITESKYRDLEDQTRHVRILLHRLAKALERATQ